MFTWIDQIILILGNYFIPLCLLVIVWQLHSHFSTPKKFPPGPWGLPFIGYLPWIPKTNTILHITKLQEKYGPLVSFYVGRHLVVILGNYDVIREAYVNQGDAFSGKPRHSPMEIDGDEKGISVSDGPIWREQRRFVMKTLRDYGVGKQSIEPALKEEICCFMQELIKLNGKPVQLRERVGTSISNNICSLEFGKRFDYSDGNFLSIKRLLDQLTLRLELIPKAMFFTWLKAIPGTQYFMNYGKLKVLKRGIYKFIGRIVSSHETQFETSEHRDIIYAWLDETEERLAKSVEFSVFNRDNLFFNLLSLFVAGTQTVASTLLSGIYYLAKNPEIQDKCRKEIYEQIGSDRLPSISDKMLMPYLEATMLEIQRITSINPLGLVHRCMKDTILNGYDIPKDAVILSNLYAVHYDPNVWPEPHEFRPDRFLNSQQQVINQDKIIPFSIGKRVCLGMSLAKAEIFLYLSALIQNFQFLPPDPKNFDVEFIGGVVRMPDLFNIRAISLETMVLKNITDDVCS